MSDKVPSICLRVDFYSKGRNLRWVKKHGYEAIAILQAVWIASSQEKNFKIKKEDSYAIPFMLSFDDKKVKTVLESAVEEGLLDAEGEYYFNSQVVSDGKNFQKKRENYRKGFKKRKTIHDESIINPSTIHDESIQNRSSILLNTELLNTEDEDLKKNSLEFDTLEIKLSSAGIKFDGCAKRAFELAQSQYKTTKPNVFQLTKGWVYQELLKEQTQRYNSEAAEIRLKKARKGPKRELSSGEIAQQMIQESRKERGLI